MKKSLGWILAVCGFWMLVAPQSLTGLKQLRWMHTHTFSGEILLGIVALSLAYLCLDLNPGPAGEGKKGIKQRCP